MTLNVRLIFTENFLFCFWLDEKFRSKSIRNERISYFLPYWEEKWLWWEQTRALRTRRRRFTKIESFFFFSHARILSLVQTRLFICKNTRSDQPIVINASMYKCVFVSFFFCEFVIEMRSANRSTVNLNFVIVREFCGPKRIEQNRSVWTLRRSFWTRSDRDRIFRQFSYFCFIIFRLVDR